MSAKRTILGAVGAALVVLTVALVPAAFGATPAANGKDYLLPNGHVYQYSSGSFHLIPDLATANAMGIKWNFLNKVKTVSPVGAPIVSILPPPKPLPTRAPAMMANGKDYLLPNGNLFQLVNGTYRMIPDLATANAMGIKWNFLNKVKSVSPIGAPLPSVYTQPAAVCSKTTASSVKANGRDVILPNNELFQYSSGAYHMIPDVATANAMGVKWNMLTRVKSVSPIGASIASVCVG
jgi:hypothetical protein